MMIIEDKNMEKMDDIKRINNNIIYLGHIEGQVASKTLNQRTRTVKRKIKPFKFENQVFVRKELEDNKSYLHTCLKFKLEVKKEEILEITKVILIKEISCSFYE